MTYTTATRDLVRDLVCDDCGCPSGAGVTVEAQQHYVGGRGWLTFYLCDDRNRCAEMQARIERLAASR